MAFLEKGKGVLRAGNFDHASNQGREIMRSCVVVMNQELLT